MRPYGLSVAEQQVVWDEWRRGKSLRFVARPFSEHMREVRDAIHPTTGGVHPRTRTRAKRSQRLAECEESIRGLAAGES
jgi:hypothetical protein